MASLQLSRLIQFRGQDLVDKVIVSTWAGELPRYPDVLDALTKMDALIIESPEPELVAPGHVLHQSKTLSLALAACPDDASFIKIRPDVMILTDQYGSVLSGQATRGTPGPGAPTLFSEKIWIHGGMLFYPFYFNDIVYYGRKLDLARLADCDLKAEVFYAGMMPEQFFHLGPALSRHPLLRAFARIQRSMIAGDRIGNELYARELLRSPFWHRVWALSIRLLLDNYAVGFQPEEEAFSDAVLSKFSQYRLEDLIVGREGMPGVSYYPIAAATLFDTPSWAMAAMQGRFIDDEAQRKLLAAFDQIDNARETDDPVFPEPEAVDLAERLQACVSQYHPCICMQRDAAGPRFVGQGPVRLSREGGGEDARDLRQQNNQLRRQNERLLMELSQVRRK